MDVNADWEGAGDMLINAVWETKVGRPLLFPVTVPLVPAVRKLEHQLIDKSADQLTSHYDFTKWLLEH